MATSLAMVAIASFLDTNDDMTCARHFVVNVIVLPGPYPMSFNTCCWHVDMQIDAWEHWFTCDAVEERKRRRHESDESIVVDLDYDDDLFSDGE